MGLELFHGAVVPRQETDTQAGADGPAGDAGPCTAEPARPGESLCPLPAGSSGNTSQVSTSQERARELQDEIRRVAALIADTAELSARVHEQVAEVHAGLGERSRLAPELVRRHVERDQAFAASERTVAAGGTAASDPDRTAADRAAGGPVDPADGD